MTWAYKYARSRTKSLWVTAHSKLGSGTWPTDTLGEGVQRIGAFSSAEQGYLFLGNMQDGSEADRGAEIFMGARRTDATADLAYAKIIGARENGTSGDAATYLAFLTSIADGTVTEWLRIPSTGIVAFVGGISTTTGTFTSNVTVGGTLSKVGANGQQTTITHATTLLSALSGATVTATNLIPAGSLVLGVTARVTTLITGATSFEIGDGTDVDRWGTAVAVAANTTTDIANFTIASPVNYTAANNVVLTANGSNFTAGAVRLTVHYIDLVAATS